MFRLQIKINFIPDGIGPKHSRTNLQSISLLGIRSRVASVCFEFLLVTVPKYGFKFTKN